MNIYGIIDNNLYEVNLQQRMIYMKTIRTLAGEIGVTKQAIFQKMKKEPLASSLNNLTTRVGGIVYVYPEGEGMIKEQFHKMQQVFTMPHVDDAGVNNVNILHDTVKILQQQIDRKDRQLNALSLHISIKDKQIEGLNRHIDKLGAALSAAQEQARVAQILHAGDIHREIIEKLIASQKDAKKEGFWKKGVKTNTPPAG